MGALLKIVQPHAVVAQESALNIIHTVPPPPVL